MGQKSLVNQSFRYIVSVKKMSDIKTFFSTTTYAAIPHIEHEYEKQYKRLDNPRQPIYRNRTDRMTDDGRQKTGCKNWRMQLPFCHLSSDLCYLTSVI